MLLTIVIRGGISGPVLKIGKAPPMLLPHPRVFSLTRFCEKTCCWKWSKRPEGAVRILQNLRRRDRFYKVADVANEGHAALIPQVAHAGKTRMEPKFPAWDGNRQEASLRKGQPWRPAAYVLYAA